MHDAEATCPSLEDLDAARQESRLVIEEYARRARELPSEQYSRAGHGELFVRQARERAVLAALRREKVLPLRQRDILEVGCGDGQWLIDLETWGADRGRLAGIELIPERAELARRRLTQSDDEGRHSADIRVGHATQLPWDAESYDIVVQSMMFSSILDPAVRRSAAREITRVLKPDGVVLWYDFVIGNPRNHRVRGIRRPALGSLFPGFTITSARPVLSPPIARRLAARSWWAASLVQLTRALNTQYVAVLRRRR